MVLLGLSERWTVMKISVGVRFALLGVVLAVPAGAWAQTTQEVRPRLPFPLSNNPSLPPPTQPVHDPRLEVTPADFQFGEVWMGSPAKREFTIKNVSDAALSLTADSSCGCTVPTQPKSPLAAGESSTFTVTYDTKRIGRAHKTVTLRLADTREALWTIAVQGNVKPIYAATPPAPIIFEGLEADSVATKTIKLENKYDRPLTLKLLPAAVANAFDVRLNEIKPEMEYELVVTSKPPLQKGFNRATATLEIGLPGVEKMQFQISANVQPRVLTTPMRLLVPPDSTAPAQQTVRVQYRTDKPVKVLEVRTDHGPIQWELLPSPEVKPEAKLASHQLRVTLPDAGHLPADGAQLIITTDDPAPEFQRLTIPIVLGGAPSPARTLAEPSPMPTASAPAPAQPGSRAP
jgi:hypothetical protein